MIKPEDFELLKAKGISENDIFKQIEIFESGIPYIFLHAPANPSKGIKIFSEDKQVELISFFDRDACHYSLLKFVPASGAASRMFKDVFNLKEVFNDKEQFQKQGEKIESFIVSLPSYAFYAALKKKLEENGFDIDMLKNENDFNTVSDYILFEEGLNYANTPKALIDFHKYDGFVRTSIEEHLVEGALYCKGKNDSVNLHFTVSPEHMSKIKELILSVKDKYEAYFKVGFSLSYSIQKPSTDTIAVDMNNKPFREKNGMLLFRPGGHGALIQNLNECQEDMIFIKNIDNVVPDRIKDETVRYKKLIGGLLLKLKDEIKYFLEILTSANCTDEQLEAICVFAEKELFIDVNPAKLLNSEDLKKWLTTKLNRPIRVCGMVKNEGEPGGGPFWVKDLEKNGLSLQIVESSQINLQDKQQKEILEKSTHFNPVDLVCWIKDFKGNKFNLLDYVDQNTGFISIKSKDGRDLKALELPGLWNGAMADWITVFVEVPIITFNPVKTIGDLLRKEHS